ncbi:uncharacterized protein LOC121865160 [Homarus americanus]|uniref:Crustacyanin-A2 subunit-like 6 n=1 Tax=Homarus americanus TaxID=6706 RepID=A0A8J5KE58_HOMAM|nr:uncharacterized protein LOC121865160 [Homarus americanus]XP_042220400.1 uncharacterized protein LOC121865160 [Homarus americanus]KAG7169948.1 Crustacyanin-A2 subunit-like 6 [Homarus americanus]
MLSLPVSHESKRILQLLLLLTGSLVHSVEGLFGLPDFLQYGACAQVTLVENFDPVKYGGLWFDISHVPNNYQQTKACITQNYTWMGNYLKVQTGGLTDEGREVKQDMMLLPADELPSAPNLAHMRVIVDGMPESPYQVVTTDYINYSCVYSCLEYFGFRAEFMWLLGRKPSLSANDGMKCYDYFTSIGVDHTKMKQTTQEQNCPYMEKLDQMLESNRFLMARNMGSELPREAKVLSTTQQPTTTLATTPVTTPVTTQSPRSTPATTQPATNIIQTASTPIAISTSSRPPTTTLVTENQHNFAVSTPAPSGSSHDIPLKTRKGIPEDMNDQSPQTELEAFDSLHIVPSSDKEAMGREKKRRLGKDSVQNNSVTTTVTTSLLLATLTLLLLH